MASPRIAIATCNGYADLKVDDDLLREALRVRGAAADSIAWDGAGADWSDYDLCLVRSTWDYHEKHAEFLVWARQVEAVTALRNPAELIAWNSDKTYLRELAEAGVRTVPTLWVERDSGIDPAAALAERGWNEMVVVKPVVDLGAKNLHRVRADDAQEALATVLERHDAMVQPFLPSLEAEGETSLVYIEGIFSHAVRKRPAAGDFRVQSIWGGTVAAATAEPEQLEVAYQALGQLEKPPLYARVDLVTGLDGNPALIEPNLYLSTDQAAASRLADAVIARL